MVLWHNCDFNAAVLDNLIGNLLALFYGVRTGALVLPLGNLLKFF